MVSSLVRVPRLLAISRRAAHPGENLVPWLEALRSAGVEGAQLREKDLTDLELLKLTASARAAMGAATTLLVNGRLDIALAAGADGVHLTSTGLPVAALRQRFGARPVIGRSTHHLDEIRAARDGGADYVTFGPVWATPGKEDFGEPCGPRGLARAVELGLPVLALGGVTIERLAAVANCGAAGAAGIRVFLDTERRAAIAAMAAAAHRLFPRD